MRIWAQVNQQIELMLNTYAKLIFQIILFLRNP